VNYVEMIIIPQDDFFLRNWNATPAPGPEDDDGDDSGDGSALEKRGHKRHPFKTHKHGSYMMGHNERLTLEVMSKEGKGDSKAATAEAKSNYHLWQESALEDYDEDIEDLDRRRRRVAEDLERRRRHLDETTQRHRHVEFQTPQESKTPVGTTAAATQVLPPRIGGELDIVETLSVAEYTKLMDFRKQQQLQKP